MGWNGITTSHRYTRKDVNTYLRSQWHHAKSLNGGHFEVIKSATKGNLWVALIKHTLSDGQTGLCLQTALWESTNNEFLYKDLGDPSNAQLYDIPASWINQMLANPHPEQTPEQQETEQAWLTAVERYRVRNQFIANARKTGAAITVQLNNGRTLQAQWNPTYKAWVTRRDPGTSLPSRRGKPRIPRVERIANTIPCHLAPPFADGKVELSLLLSPK